MLRSMVWSDPSWWSGYTAQEWQQWTEQQRQRRQQHSGGKAQGKGTMATINPPPPPPKRWTEQKSMA
eukprot:11933468-Alexandrium_andersonii.AAC.1